MRTRRLGVWLASVWLLAGSARAEPSSQPLIGVRPAQQADLPERELGPIAALPHYELALSLRDDLSGYALDEDLMYTNTTRAPLDDVVLRLFGNSGPAPLIKLIDSRCLDQECRITQPSPSAIRVQPKLPLAPGASLRVRLQLTGTLRVIASGQTDMLTQGLASISTLLSGEQASDYGLLSIGEGIVSLANFYAVVAHRNGSNWVSSEMKPLGDLGAQGVSCVRASVRAARNLVIASSGVMSENLAAGDALHRTQTIEANLIRDFALFASRDFSQQSKMVGDVTVRAFSLARDAESNARVLDTAARALAVFERRFGPYPYTDLDVVEAPLVGGAGGAEFSGIISVASMLYRPLLVDKEALKLLGGTQGSALEFTTAHEVAHQYWYGLVGSEAREHPFVDESLTQWSAVQYFEDRFGAQRASQEGDAQVRMNYRLMRLMGTADGAVDQPVDAFASALVYAGLVYGKGAYMYPLLRKLCGDRAFFAGLRAYAHKYRFQEAPAQALIEILAKASKEPAKVRSLAQRWLEQTHGDEDLGSATLENMLASLTGTSERIGTKKARKVPGANGLGAGVDLAALSGLLRGLLGGAASTGANPSSGNMQGLLDERTWKALLGQLQGGGQGNLQELIGGLMQQVDQGVNQLPKAPPP